MNDITRIDTLPREEHWVRVYCDEITPPSMIGIHAGRLKMGVVEVEPFHESPVYSRFGPAPYTDYLPKNRHGTVLVIWDVIVPHWESIRNGVVFLVDDRNVVWEAVRR